MTIERDAPGVSTIPSRDPAFRRVVQSVLSAGTSAKQLADRLRPLYPQVAVFVRALSGEGRHLYVYRDGAYHREPGGPWWNEPGVAGTRVSTVTGRLTYVSPRSAVLMAGERDSLVGRHYTDFVLPEARPAAATLFGALLEEREVDSVVRVAREDGSLVTVDFHASRTDEEIEVRYRIQRPGE